MSTELLVGIDGGASKTFGAMSDLEGNVLATVRTGRCVIEAVPSESTRETLADVLADLCRQAGVTPDTVACCALGINGVDIPEQFADQHAGASTALELDSERVLLVNDGIVALWGASPAEAVAILQHGSGFTTAYRSTWGCETLFDHLNVGRQFDFRRELVNQVGRMIDGRTPVTPLRDKVLAHFGIADASLYHELIYRGRIPNNRLLTTSPLLFEAWSEGDPVASKLVESALTDYALTGCTMLARTGNPDAEMAFGGGVLRAAPSRFWTLLEARIKTCCPRAVVKQPELPPEHGALVMAAFHEGQDVRSFFSRLSQSLEREQGRP
jgi:N-acetylglucosamine kinase-like BadF-type ATPase